MKRSPFSPSWSARFFYFAAWALIMGTVLLGYCKGKSETVKGQQVLIFSALAQGIPMLLAGRCIHKRDIRIAGAHLDRLAEHTLKRSLSAARRGEQQPIALYLRPFDLTNKLQYFNPNFSVISLSKIKQSGSVELESLLAEALSLSTPLVALGEPGEHIGAGRAFLDEEEWREGFRNLASVAERILIVPSANEGTLWEIAWLKENNLLDKCLFIMPPESLFQYLLAVDMSALWDTARSALLDKGITLPEYDEDGMFFTLDSGGNVAASVNPSRWTNTNAFAESIARLLHLADEAEASLSVEEVRTQLQTPSAKKRRTANNWAFFLVGLDILVLWTIVHHIF